MKSEKPGWTKTLGGIVRFRPQHRQREFHITAASPLTETSKVQDSRQSNDHTPANYPHAPAHFS